VATGPSIALDNLKNKYNAKKANDALEEKNNEKKQLNLEKKLLNYSNQ
jgi:hypothetical protein